MLLGVVDVKNISQKRLSEGTILSEFERLKNPVQIEISVCSGSDGLCRELYEFFYIWPVIDVHHLSVLVNGETTLELCIHSYLHSEHVKGSYTEQIQCTHIVVLSLLMSLLLCYIAFALMM